MTRRKAVPYEVELRAVSRIRRYANNPRINGEAVTAVAASLQQFGWRQPIVIDPSGEIIVGDTRYLAALQLGYARVPVHVARGLTPEQIRAYRIADNKVGEVSVWDFPRLEAEMQALTAEHLDLAMTGFAEDELAAIALQAAEARRIALADFTPAQAEEQGRLDQKTPVTCPKCGHVFSPA